MIDFVGIGAQKAATTWIYQMLDAHPEVCMAEGKEVHYFSRFFDKGNEWYESKFNHCKEDSLKKGEISASYLSSINTPKRIHDYNPDMKLIVSLRNPVDRAVSHIKHLYSKDRISRGTSLEKVLKEHPEIVKNGLYGKHLSCYLDYFDEDQILVIKFKNIKKSPERVVKEIYNFINVDSTLSPDKLNEKYNTSNQRSSYLYRKTAKLYQKLKKNSVGEFILNTLRKVGINHGVVKKILEVTPSRSQPELSREELSVLRSKFVEDVKLLDDVATKTHG